MSNYTGYGNKINGMRRSAASHTINLKGEDIRWLGSI